MVVILVVAVVVLVTGGVVRIVVAKYIVAVQVGNQIDLYIL